MANTIDDIKSARNEDPITGEPGSHPIGVGLGTAAGGIAAGAALGASIGPVGAVAGAVVGGIFGAAAGKGLAEAIDPTVEDAYWSEEYSTRPYVEPNTPYETYRSAYHYGIQSNNQYPNRTFSDVEPELSRNWETARGNSSLTWDRARPAVSDAYERSSRLRQEYLATQSEKEDAF